MRKELRISGTIQNAENDTMDSEAEQTFCNHSDVIKSCEICSFEASSEKDLEVHIKSFNSKEFQCEYCVFKCKNEGSLK